MSCASCALALEADPREQAGIWQRIGRACALKYDGAGCWEAMQKALDIGGPSAEVYADVALESVQRMGMWAQEPDWSLVEQWARQALELAEEGSLIQGKALLALSMETDDLALTRSALAIAERLGDLELRCQSLTTLSHFAWAARDYGPACAVMDELLAVLPELPNPDVRATAFLLAVFCYLRAGKLGQAAHASAQLAETAAGLTPHHRLHAASTHILLPTLTGRWNEVQARTAEAGSAATSRAPAASP